MVLLYMHLSIGYREHPFHNPGDDFNRHPVDRRSIYGLSVLSSGLHTVLDHRIEIRLEGPIILCQIVSIVYQLTPVMPRTIIATCLRIHDVIDPICLGAEPIDCMTHYICNYLSFVCTVTIRTCSSSNTCYCSGCSCTSCYCAAC